MPQATKDYEALGQNMADAGCSAETIRLCLSLAESGQWEKLRRELKKHRGKLLDTLHESERQIDCLDYLLYELNRKNKITLGGK